MKLAVQVGREWREVGPLPSADDGIAATIAAMQAVVDHAVTPGTTARARLDTLRASLGWTPTAGLAGGHVKSAERLYRFMVERVTFRPDPPGVELVRSPGMLAAVVLRGARVQVDCDDGSVFAAAMLALDGQRPAFVTVGRNRNRPWGHVLPAVVVGDGLGPA